MFQPRGAGRNADDQNHLGFENRTRSVSAVSTVCTSGHSGAMLTALTHSCKDFITLNATQGDRIGPGMLPAALSARPTNLAFVCLTAPVSGFKGRLDLAEFGITRL